MECWWQQPSVLNLIVLTDESSQQGYWHQVRQATKHTLNKRATMQDVQVCTLPTSSQVCAAVLHVVAYD